MTSTSSAMTSPRRRRRRTPAPPASARTDFLSADRDAPRRRPARLPAARDGVSTPRLGVDIGRTFTDFALLDEARGELTVLKLPATPERPSASVFEGVETLRRRRGLDPGAVMAAAPSGREVLGRHRGVRERL